MFIVIAVTLANSYELQILPVYQTRDTYVTIYKNQGLFVSHLLV